MNETGITPGYHDTVGRWHETSPGTRAALLAAMGGADDDPDGQAAGAAGGGPVLTVRSGTTVALDDGDGPWEIRTEDGAVLDVGGEVPADLPPGYHELVRRPDGHRRLLVVSPGRCRLPPGPTWGFAAQLPATRSTGSWGIGDFADLRRLAAWSRGLGAGMVLVSPLHASAPGDAQASPYYPSSRCFRNPIHLRVEEVPGAADAELAVTLDELGGQARALLADRRIDRRAVAALKTTALERLWARFSASGGDPAFDRWRADAGAGLAGFATHCALTERFRRPWPHWPEEYRRPDGPSVARFAAEPEAGLRIGFHSWLQWLAERQLVAAGAQLPLVADLAVGADPGGADGWLWQDALAPGVRVGAPPDDFNPAGQDWGLPAFDPQRLRAVRYEPWIRALRAGFTAAGGLRIDHVMGLFRLFWIPPGGTPADGAYVRYPSAEMLDILALESHRAGAFVVGEDLGTVEDEVRAELARRGVLSYRLAWFEPSAPAHYPVAALAAVTTHDLPTVAGLWSGGDVAERRRLGLDPGEEWADALRGRLASMTGCGGDARPEEVVCATYARLAQAPSLILAATLEDATLAVERPNIPGTIDERPNWSLALPLTLEEIEADSTVRAIAAVLCREGGDEVPVGGEDDPGRPVTPAWTG